MIRRALELDRLIGLLKRFPVVGIIGARRVGKTTLGRLLRKSITTSNRFSIDEQTSVIASSLSMSSRN